MIKVFVNGTFDVLHSGHLQLLAHAKSLGDTLLVALDTDDRVSSKKGPSRPVNSLVTRLHIMSFLKPVDSVTAFSNDAELESIIKNYCPDVMVVGSDWQGKSVIGSQYAKRLVFFDRIKNFSTSATLDKYLGSIRENDK
jgi:D-beta-D-heptose 7-phosphate kinase/D-beta-D-heptose 1-phosphate adenosyltransferase